MDNLDGQLKMKLKEDFVRNFNDKYDNAVQAHAFRCSECKTPFMTTYRKFENVKCCPYCGSDYLESDNNLKGIFIVVLH